MKDHVEIGHLTKYDVFRVYRDQVIDLVIWFKTHTEVCSFETASPESYKLLDFFMISVVLFKMGKHSSFHLSFSQIVGGWWDFTVVSKLIKNVKSLHGFGGHCLKIRDVCMDLEPYFKVHNSVSVHPKSIILGQMTNLSMIFHVVVSVYRLPVVKIWNSPQFPDEFQNSQLRTFVLSLYAMTITATTRVEV